MGKIVLIQLEIRKVHYIHVNVLIHIYICTYTFSPVLLHIIFQYISSSFIKRIQDSIPGTLADHSAAVLTIA